MRRFIGAAHERLVYGRRVRRLVELLAPLMPRGATVTDVGSGDGLIASLVLAARPDVSIRAFDVLARPTSHVPVEVFDGSHIPLPDGGCDVVMLVDVLHHTDDPPRLLAECARVARTGVVVKDHLREGFAAGPTLRLMDWVGNAPHGVRLPYNYLTRAEWTAALDVTGLAIDSWNESLGLYAWPLDAFAGRHLHFVARFVPRRG